MSSITKDERGLEVIKQWKELKITSVEFHFDCGGDSMGSTDFYVKTNEGDINAPDIVGYFEDEIYRNVEFYEASDGEYMGEAGVVDITLIEDEGEEPYFQYDKQSKSEWSTNFSQTVKVELTKEEADFIRTHVLRFEGGSNESDVISYKNDFIMSDEQQILLDGIMEKINVISLEYEMELDDSDIDDYVDVADYDSTWYQFEYLNIDENDVLFIEVHKNFIAYKEEE